MSDHQENPAHLSIPLINFDHGRTVNSREEVISEASVLLSVNGQEWFNFLCTPLNIKELAIGFLFTSGMINSAGEIRSVEMCANRSGVDVWLSHPVEKPGLWQRNSGCSGGISVSQLRLEPIPETQRFEFTLVDIDLILSTFYKAQSLYHITGGVHASALFSKTDLICLEEDIGRHNTLDKIAGKILLREMDITSPVLITSGRISLEMMQKAAMLRSGFVISRTSPTTASIELADRLGICLIGYAANGRFKVYSHSEWVRSDEVIGNEVIM